MDIWKPDSPVFHRSASGTKQVLDNRSFIFGLDAMYRDAMKQFESRTLLSCAQRVAKALHLLPAEVPIEGYYHETPQLEEYFRLMRALQDAGQELEAQVEGLDEFQLLWEVTNSPLYGRPQRHGKLFPVARDPLAQALLDLVSDWRVETLVSAAYDISLQYDDFSLVGLAARTKDAIALTAARESAVLYAEMVTLGVVEGPNLQVEWRVDEILATAANLFIDTFNRFVSSALPRAEAANADIYYEAYADSDIIGRCVRLGQTEDGSRHYHWAIAVREWGSEGLDLAVDEFWSEQVWTTERYRMAQGQPFRMRLFQTDGVPEYPWGWP